MQAFSSGYDGSDNANHKDSIQVLHPVKTYHYDDACTCFVKDTKDDAVISKLKALPIIFNYTIYDLTKMDEWDFKDHMIQLCEVQMPKREKVEKTYQEILATNKVAEKASKEQAKKEARPEQ